jgi:hypothetical protein
MTTSFPSGLDSFTNPTSGDTLASPDHAAQHADVNDAVEALQAKVGVDGSAVTTSLDYKVANQGLTFVKSQTIGSGVASVTVNDAFSSTFENYRIVMSGVKSTANGNNVSFLLNGSSSWYFYSGIKTDIDAPVAQYGFNQTSYLCGLTGTGSAGMNLRIDVYNPNLATQTCFESVGVGMVNSYMMSGFHYLADAYTGFDIVLSTGTMTGGKIRVYGYNNG